MPYKPNVSNGFQQQARSHEMEKKPTTEDLLLQYMQKMDVIIQSQNASMRALEMQMGQLASALNNCPQGSLPSNTEPNPNNEKGDHYKVITLRSGKEIDGNTKKVEEEVTIEYKTNEESDKVVSEEPIDV